MLSTGNATLNTLIKSEIASSKTLKSTHQVTAEWNYNAYITMSEIGCLTQNGSSPDGLQSLTKDDGVQLNYYSTTDESSTLIEKDSERSKITPLRDIFKINRPKPGIVHSVFTTNASKNKVPLNGDGDKLSISRVFNMVSEDTRLYPISSNSPYHYWKSARKVNGTL